MVIKKNVLITAGPTWVPIDSVRVISNIATGETGIFLAEALAKAGAEVTLILGPVSACCLNKKIRVINFKFFEELRDIIKRELRRKKYDIIIHSAAVSDFRPKQQVKGKISSKKSISLKLLPLPKIIRDIRRLALNARLVIFKLESGVSDEILMQRAKKALSKFQADLVAANRLQPNYKAFILGQQKIYYAVNSKKELVTKLIKLL